MRLDAELMAARGRTSLRARVARLRAKGWVIGQCAIAAGVAWWLAADVFEHRLPFFAPIAAVVSLGHVLRPAAAAGRRGDRRRRARCALGDVTTHLIGSGGLQIIFIVAAGMSIALLLDAGPAADHPGGGPGHRGGRARPGPGDAFLRWTDALIGGAWRWSPPPSCRVRRCASPVTRRPSWSARSPTCCAAPPTGSATATSSWPSPPCATPARPTPSSASCGPPRRRGCRS